LERSDMKKRSEPAATGARRCDHDKHFSAVWSEATGFTFIAKRGEADSRAEPRATSASFMTATAKSPSGLERSDMKKRSEPAATSASLMTATAKFSSGLERSDRTIRI